MFATKDTSRATSIVSFASAASVTLRFAVPGVFISLLIYLIWQQRRDGKDKLSLPPTPPGNFILGNTVEVIQASTKGLQNLLMEKWAKKYGDIFRVRIGPFEENFLNSDRAVKVYLHWINPCFALQG